MQPSQLLIQWNRDAKQIAIVPTDMTDAEVQAVLLYCLDQCSNQVIKQGQEKRVSLASGPLPCCQDIAEGKTTHSPNCHKFQ